VPPQEIFGPPGGGHGGCSLPRVPEIPVRCSFGWPAE